MKKEQLTKAYDFAIAIKQMAMQVEPLTSVQQQKIFEYAEQIQQALDRVINPEKFKP